MARFRLDLLLLYRFVLGAILLMAAPAAAQVTTSVGVQGGLNDVTVVVISDAAQSFRPNFQSRTRLVFGAFGAWDFNPKLGLQIEALYSQKGLKLEFANDEGAVIRHETRLDYLEFPVLIRTNLPASDTVTVRLFAGPALGFKVSHDFTTTVDGQAEARNDFAFKPRDVGLVIGGGVRFGQVLVDIRYNWGMTNILVSDEPIRDPSLREEMRNRTFGVMVGFSR